MRISLKVILFCWLGLFLIVGAFLFNAYSKLKPETFIALLTEQVQRNYPGSELTVGDISYRFSLDFNLNLKSIVLKRSGKQIGSVGEVELRLPWWLLLLDRGNAQINITNLDIFIDHEVKPNIQKSDLATKPNVIKVSVPSYLSSARFTLRAKDISVRDIHNSRNYFILSKLLVREFKYGKNSAFELNIPVSITHGGLVTNSEFWFFGDITPSFEKWNLNYRGEIRSKENSDKFQLDDLVLNGKASFVPSSLAVHSDLKLFMEKIEIGEGTLWADQDNLSVVAKFSKLPLHSFGFIYDEIKNPYLKKVDTNAEGLIKFNKSFQTSQGLVTGKINFDGNFYLSEKDYIPGKWQVAFQDSRWDVSFMSPKGEASFFRRSVVDQKTSVVTQYSEELGFSGLQFDSAITPVIGIDKFINELPSSYYTTSISYSNCIQGEKVISGNFKYGFSPHQKFYLGDLADKNSNLKISYTHKGDDHSLDINALNFNINSSVNILSPWVSGNKLLATGKVEGRWVNKPLAGQWLLNLNLKEMESFNGRVFSFANMTASIFDIDFKNIQKMNLDLSIRNNLINLGSLNFEGTEHVKISGLLNSDKKSFLTIYYPQNKKLKSLKKDIQEPYWVEKEGM